MKTRRRWSVRATAIITAILLLLPTWPATGMESGGNTIITDLSTLTNGTSAEALELIRMAKEAVLSRHGISLETEVKIWV